MAFGPDNKITTTGLINRKPMIPEAPVMQDQQVQQFTQDQNSSCSSVSRWSINCKIPRSK